MESASLCSHLRDADLSIKMVGLQILKVEKVFLIKGWRMAVHFHNEVSTPCYNDADVE